MTDRTCSEDGCGRRPVARGLCGTHYQQAAKAGLPPLVRQNQTPCLVADCGNSARAHGVCNGHYKRLQAFGDVQAHIPLQKKRRGRAEVCSTPGCDRAYMAKGLCGTHYNQARAAQMAEEPCLLTECARPRLMKTTGYCAPHYQRWLKYGDPLAGPRGRCQRGTGDRWAADAARRAAGAYMSLVTGETREYVKILRGDPCVYCGDPCEHIDHIVAFIKGGPTDCTNLAPACATCNLQKSDMDLLTFMLRRSAGQVSSERPDGPARGDSQPVGESVRPRPLAA